MNFELFFRGCNVKRSEIFYGCGANIRNLFVVIIMKDLCVVIFYHVCVLAHESISPSKCVVDSFKRTKASCTETR